MIDEPPLATTDPTVPATNDVPRRERRDAAEHRRRVLQAARELFLSKGVDATSMYEIAKRAGVGQGTLYRRYAHKGDLCMALLDENGQQFRSDIAALVHDDQTSALDRIDAMWQRMIAFNEENAHLLGAIVDAACGPRRTDAYNSPFYTWLHGMTAQLLQQAIDHGEARSINISCVTDMLLAPLAIDLYLHQRKDRGYSADQILQSLRHLLLDGLRAR